MRLLQECCGEGHKHYVVNSESLAGVCVRHNDDCNALCVPTKEDDTRHKRVCTKGCNRIVKARKENVAEDETKEKNLLYRPGREGTCKFRPSKH